MATGKEYAAEALKVYNLSPKAGYIWGKMNELWTAQKQANLVAKYNSDPSKYDDLKLGAQIGSKWIGHRVWDCSGLTKYCGQKVGITTYHHGSNSSYRNDCSHKGKITKGLKLPVGAWVYTGTASNHGHIGIVVDSEWVVEAQGTKAGVVKSKISLSKWTYWGLGKGLSFDFIPGGAAENQQKPTTNQNSTKPQQNTSDKIKYPTIRRGAKGDLVVQLQRFLAKDGYDLEIDGIFGPATQNAVKSFQKKHKLSVDGIVGPQTWGALLKLV